MYLLRLTCERSVHFRKSYPYKMESLSNFQMVGLFHGQINLFTDQMQSLMWLIITNYLGAQKRYELR